MNITIAQSSFKYFKLFIISVLIIFTISIFVYHRVQESHSLEFSKQKGNIKSDEFIEWTDEELLEEYKNAIDKAWKLKIQKELKARGVKNKQKSRGKKQ